MIEEHGRAEDNPQEYYAEHPFDPEPLIDFWTEVAADDWEEGEE